MGYYWVDYLPPVTSRYSRSINNCSLIINNLLVMSEILIHE